MTFPGQQGQQVPGIDNLIVRDVIAAVPESVSTETGSDTGIPGSIKIGMMIANHHCLLRVAIKLEQCLLQRIGVRFFMGIRIATDDRTKKTCKVKSCENPAGIEDRFIGNQRHALRIVALQQFYNSGIAMSLVKQVLAIDFQEALKMAFIVKVVSQSPLDQHGRPISNHAGNLGGCQGSDFQFLAQQIDGGHQVGDGVDQRAVEIKKQKLGLRIC